MTLCLAAAAAAAAPVAPLATEGAGPAEAVLPAGAAMGRGSHGECTVGVSPFPPMRFIVVVLGLEVLYETCQFLLVGVIILSKILHIVVAAARSAARPCDFYSAPRAHTRSRQAK